MIQIRIFTYEQQDELNDFLKVAHLYNTPEVQAVQFKEKNIVVIHKDNPVNLDPFIAEDTMFSTIRGLKENLIQYEADIRQWGWRIEWKKNRATELKTEIEATEKLKNEIETKEPDRKEKEAWKEWSLKSKDALHDVQKKLEKARKELEALDQQIENSEAHVETHKRKIEDTQKDIDVALNLAKELGNGTFKIYGQVNVGDGVVAPKKKK